MCQGLTVTLMLRSVGALVFGTLSDRYGRKWPMIINLALFIVLELASGFCNTLPQFLGVRSLYGIAMGGKEHSLPDFLYIMLSRFRSLWSSSRHSSRGPTI